MTKRELVQSLPKVKLVLGNGFDLHCGLNTRYSDYFKENLDKYQGIIDWVKHFGNVKSYLFKESSNDDFWYELKDFEKYNFWDVLFCLQSYEDDKNKLKDISNWNWCDIESVMQKWLKKADSTHEEANLYDVYAPIQASNSFYSGSNSDYLYLGAFLKKRYSKSALKNCKEFYVYILEELKKFEKSFGNFIFEQTSTQNKMKTYSDKARSSFEKMCSLNNIVSVDIFNYDEPDIKEIKGKCNHINGDISNPIFGIDSEGFTAQDDGFIFTKTNRRMELDSVSAEIGNQEEFQNVIIYGHSLNEADFNYFFSIFDKLRLTDLTNDSKVIFAYSPYRSSFKNDILSNLRKGISTLIQEYSEYKYGSQNKHRLLDQLTIQKKILIYNIEEESSL